MQLELDLRCTKLSHSSTKIQKGLNKILQPSCAMKLQVNTPQEQVNYLVDVHNNQEFKLASQQTLQYIENLEKEINELCLAYNLQRPELKTYR